MWYLLKNTFLFVDAFLFVDIFDFNLPEKQTSMPGSHTTNVELVVLALYNVWFSVLFFPPIF
jgi:hypothetical protein